LLLTACWPPGSTTSLASTPSRGGHAFGNYLSPYNWKSGHRTGESHRGDDRRGIPTPEAHRSQAAGQIGLMAVVTPLASQSSKGPMPGRHAPVEVMGTNPVIFPAHWIAQRMRTNIAPVTVKIVCPIGGRGAAKLQKLVGGKKPCPVTRRASLGHRNRGDAFSQECPSSAPASANNA
jgi:hypothetical protein